ncbi:MAG TPA: DUF881 domain-containing protein [Candidatus Limnocylindria bacterium]|jgi:uncharacterized protein YlxW (UPF0749 family)|nr:DUF881 domain-containing protein [Candidatus Limnocylindria bacterium]
MRRPLAQASLFGVALIVGMLLVGQLRSQQRPTEISSLNAQELSELVDTLGARNRELRTGLADLQETLRGYRLTGPQGQSALEVGREDLRRITAFGGLAAVQGEGIVLEVDGNLDAIALNDLLNELRNAGAEALAVDDVRITQRSVAVQGPVSLLIDGHQVGNRFTLNAIGSPDGLLATMERPGGIIAQLQQFIDASIVATQSDRITVPATSISLVPTIAQPAQ